MADIKVSYAASVALTFTSLSALASSITWVAGAESTAVDNSSNLYMDYLLAGNFKTAAANAKIGRLEVWVIAMLNDTDWPDVFDGTDSVETTSSVDQKSNAGRLAGVVVAPVATNDMTYPFAPVSVAQLFGGVCPRKFSVFVTHDIQTSALPLAAATSTVNAMWVTPVKFTVT